MRILRPVVLAAFVASTSLAQEVWSSNTVSGKKGDVNTNASYSLTQLGPQHMRITLNANARIRGRAGSGKVVAILVMQTPQGKPLYYGTTTATVGADAISGTNTKHAAPVNVDIVGPIAKQIITKGAVLAFVAETNESLGYPTSLSDAAKRVQGVVKLAAGLASGATKNLGNAVIVNLRPR